MGRSTNLVVGMSALAVLSASGAPVSAAITSVSGQAQFLAVAPVSCAPGALFGPPAFAWDEQTNVPLNIISNLTNNPGSSGAPVPGALVGLYDSHFIHWEVSTVAFNVTGTVTFSSPILGVDYRALDLDATDIYGAGGTAYPTGYPFRTIATNPPSSFSINANVLSFHFDSLIPTLDIVQLRVYTAAVPAPGAAALLGLGGLVAMRRRRR